MKKTIIIIIACCIALILLDIGANQVMKGYFSSHQELPLKSKSLIHASYTLGHSIICASMFLMGIFYIRRESEKPMVFSFNGKLGRYTIHVGDQGNPYNYLTLVRKKSPKKAGTT